MERGGVISVIFLIFVITIVPYFFHYFVTDETYEMDSFKNELAQLKIDSSGNRTYTGNATNEYSRKFNSSKNVLHTAELFYFNPNTASVNDWVRLGLREKTALTIQKYISKGGKFYKPADLKKIYGLGKSDAERLMPYVTIESQKKYPENEKREFTKAAPVYKSFAIQKVDINLADTSAFISLPGIGSKLSQRIISFRNKLGGFYSVEQVGETYLLPDSTFLKIKPFLVLTAFSIRKININTALADELKAHPYIRYSLANAIIQYRNQHGNFNSLEELKKIMIVTEDIFHKAKPYLTIE